MASVIGVLREGRGAFKPEHAASLMRGIAAHWPADVPLRRVMLTDLPLKLPDVEVRPLPRAYRGWWSKLELFAPENDDLGDLLYFDLDTVVVGPLDDLVRQSQQVLIVLRDFYRHERIGSGLMAIPAASRAAVWETWIEKPWFYMRSDRGDQEFLSRLWKTDAKRWQEILPGQIISYKVHVKRGRAIPDGARVVCFHGLPRPWSLGKAWIT